MADNKYNFFESYHRALSRVPDDSYGRVVRAMSNYVFNGIEPNLTETLDLVAWELIKPILERGSELSQIRANAGRSGGLNGKGVSRNVGNENAKSKANQKQNNSKSLANQKQNNSGIGNGNGMGNGVGGKEELANASKKKSTKPYLDLSVVIPKLRKVVTDWLEYKKERGEAYKPKGFASFYNKLLELSGGDYGKAQKIVEESMANNYAGIFPLKDKNVNGLPVGMRLPGDRNGIIGESEGW